MALRPAPRTGPARASESKVKERKVTGVWARGLVGAWAGGLRSFGLGSSGLSLCGPHLGKGKKVPGLPAWAQGCAWPAVCCRLPPLLALACACVRPALLCPFFEIHADANVRVAVVVRQRTSGQSEVELGRRRTVDSRVQRALLAMLGHVCAGGRACACVCLAWPRHWRGSGHRRAAARAQREHRA